MSSCPSSLPEYGRRREPSAPRLLALILVALAVGITACSGSADESAPESGDQKTEGGTADADGLGGADDESALTTIPLPVSILDVRQILGLQAGECWGPLPTPQPETSLPSSETVAVVDCGGGRTGLAYASGCVGSQGSEDREPVIVVTCPGRAEDAWPGDRDLQRAVVAACLPQFETGVGERFATSDLVAAENVPTVDQWALGERRYVCTAMQPGN